MAEEFDVIVIGGGAMGTATSRALAERGRATLLLERFDLGHARGGSGAATRLFRLAHDRPEDVEMARLALGAWRELEDRAGESLLHTTGGLDLGRLEDVAAALASAGVASARVPAEAARERWPTLRLPAGEVLIQEDAGVIMASRAVRAQARLAAQAGATVITQARVERLHANGFGVEVDTADAHYHATIAVLTAGAWTRSLLEQTGHRLPLQPTLEQATSFVLEMPGPMPVAVERARDDTPSTWTVPNPEEPGAFDVAVHRAGPAVDPDEPTLEPDPERVRAVVAYAAERFAPHHPTGASETGLTTNTPDDVFVLDRRGPLVIGSACNGRGSTFAPLVGRILADLATAQPAPMAIERFLATRDPLGR